MAQRSTRRKRVLGSNVVYRTDSMMAVLVAAGLRRWDNRWLCLPWLQRAACLVVAGLLLSQAQDGFSNPVGGNVVVGKATVTSSGGTVQIDQTTKIVIIDWSKFNIAKGETTQFLQPGTNALAVNRIGGNDPSQILGNLLANGRIILINGNGILFGPNAKVDVGALIATTSDASNSDIESGKSTFDKAGNPNAMVVNQGTINAKTGMVGLVAPAVRNDGVIVARLSNVTLGASNIFTVDFTGDGLISFPLDANVVSKAIDANGKPVEALVVNNGRIEGATVLLTARAAKDLVRNVVSMGGIITANRVTQQGGKVVLGTDDGAAIPQVTLNGNSGGVSVTGTVTAPGGTIVVTGSAVTLAGATLNTSSATAGGSIRIGGNDTAAVTVDQASLLAASAVSVGDGGNIYVMSNDTRFAGRAEAKGGAAGGNGGSIETSGHVLDIANASIDTSAVSGRAGNWLLDPDDYTIDATQASTIQTNLASGNVTIQTTLAGSGGNGDIFVNAPISWSNGNALTLSAYRNIAVNANIANTGGAAVTLYADSTGTGIGAVSFASGNTVSTSGAVSIFYNSSVNPADSVVNTTSYVNPAENFALNVAGGGTLTAYMLVNSVYDLQNIQNNLSGTYALGRDIDASETATWNGGAGFRPIGYSSANTTNNYWGSPVDGLLVGVNSKPAQFIGALDGQGRTIISLVITDTGAHNLGLFSWIGPSGAVRGLGLVGGSLTAGGQYSNFGMLAGWNSGTIDSVYATAPVRSIGIGSYLNMGGLVGFNWGGTIANSYATGNLTGDGSGGNLGGLVGMNGLFGFTSRILNSYATGDVSNGGGMGGLVGGNDSVISGSYATGRVTGAPGAGNLGGLVGCSNGYWGGDLITSSYATGNVTGDSNSQNVGGLIGNNSWNATLTNSYATGNVTGGSAVGGLVGWNGYGNLNQPIPAMISGSWSSSRMSGDNFVGTLVGFNNNGTITQSYWDSGITGAIGGLGGSNGGSFSATGLTSAQARAQSSYVGWDFAGTWFMIDGETRPFLRSEYSTTITNAHQLQLMAMNLSATYILANDIDLGPALAADANSNYSGMWGAAGFVPVGDFSSSFSGMFDGENHSIGNLTINRPSGFLVGLFGYIGAGATVSDVGLLGGNITGGSSVGGLAGRNGGEIIRSYASGTVSGGNKVGGLIGSNLFGTITQSYATGVVHGSSGEVGGLVGWSNGTITQSYATGTVSGIDWVGGLVGENHSGTITRSYATGSANSNGEAGGLVGLHFNGAITESYATGAVNGGGGVGGLVGASYLGSITHSYATGAVNGGSGVGGIVGQNAESSIVQSYATGAVSGTNYVGGLVGGNDSGTITQSYWDIQTTGQNDGVGHGGASGATGLTSAQARTQSSYSGWDFAGTWFMIDGETRPFLRSEYSTTITNAHQLQLVAMNLSATYTLANDVDLGPALAADANGNYAGMWGAHGFVPIGGAVSPVGSTPDENTGPQFSGVFDGQHHTISNLTINLPSSENVGLFGFVEAAGVVRNIGLLGGNVTGRFNTGELVGYNDGTISQSYATGTANGYDSVGGLVGHTEGGTITQSYATGAVNGTIAVGGLVGNNWIGSITESYATGAVHATGDINYVDGDAFAGGLVGGNGGPIANSYATGAVSGAGNGVGGLVGGNWNNGPITQSHATGAVNGNGDYVGGLVGVDWSTEPITQSYATGAVNGSGDYVGGLVGGSWAAVTQSYATGAVGGHNSVGGLVGQNHGTIEYSYATGAVAGNVYVGGLAGYSAGSISASHAGGYVEGNGGVGGLAGGSVGTITQSYATGAVNGTGNVGGMVGENGGTITQSYATGTVSGSDFVGGLVGGSNGTIMQSYATGVVHGGGNTGGLVGVLGGGGAITDSYATGAVNGTSAVGGLVGWIARFVGDASITKSYATGAVSGSDAVGGLVGAGNGTITQSYASGAVSGSYSVGGLVGSNSNDIAQSYWDTQTTGQANGVGNGDTSGTTGLTSAQARTQSSYVGWDFAGTWFMIDGETRPFLRSEYSTTITNAHQLQLMAMNLSASYTLANNIDLGLALAADANGNYSGMWGASGFVPIGPSSYGHSFEGVFDGRGNSISNLMIYRPGLFDWIGLFGSSHGTIKNVDLNSANMRGAFYTGGLVGENSGAIINAHVYDTTVTGGASVGGLVGGNTGTITGSSAIGIVNGTLNVGGLAGSSGGDISNSFATGSVFGRTWVGGLVGSLSGNVTSSYASGSVRGSDNVGGFVGYNISGTISQSYWDTQTTGQATGVGSGDTNGATGLTSAQARTQSSYAGWDFAGTWFMIDGETRPFLRSEWSATITNAYQLQLMAMNLSASYTLANDIDLGPALAADASGNYSGMWGAKGFMPVGNDGLKFVGTFDGEAHAINHLTINRPTENYIGLFGETAATADIENVGLIATNICGLKFVGSLIGYNQGLVNRTSASGTLVGTTGIGADYDGGMIGINYGTITLSSSAVNVSGDQNVGGLVGDNRGTVGRSSASGSVVAVEDAVGGLVGSNWGAIRESYATGTVLGYVYSVGGLVGGNGDGATIADSYASGAVSGPNWYNSGGLVGENAGLIKTSYSVGKTTGCCNVGGMVGITERNGSVVSSYWDVDASIQSISSGGKGLTTVQLTSGTLPGGFNRITWGAKAGSYPCLLWQSGCSAAPAQSTTTITYSVADSSSTYGTLATLGAVALTGVSAADQAYVSGVLGLFDTSSSAVSLSDSLNAGTYAVKVTSLAGSAAPNYTIAATGNHDGTLTINPAPLIVAVNNASRIYGDANPAFSANITGFVLGQNASVLSDLYLLTNATNESGVGTYGIAAAGVSGNYYIDSATDGTLTVTQRPITVTANNANRLYGDANPNLTYSVTTGMLVNDDTLSGALATSAGLTSNVDSYAITQGTVAASSNYTVTFQSGTLNVQQRPISVAADALSRSYGDANPNLTFAITSGNLVNGDTLSGALATSAVVMSGIGNYAVEQGTLAATSNYALSFHAGTLTIAPRPVSVSADSASRLYGDSNQPLTYSVTSGNLVNGDAFGGYLTTAAGVTSNAGGYAIGQGTLGLSSNYALSFTPGTLTINPTPLTIAMDNVSRAYGDANPALTATITGLKLGQDASVLSGLTYATTATQLSSVGGYAITSSGGTAENYYIAGRANGTLTVIARAITVTADTLSRVYGGQNPALTYAVTSGNLVNGDLLSGALTTTATALSNVGSYVIGQGTLAASSNYALTFQPGALVVVPRMITVAADNLSRLYGDPNGALTYTITSGNLVNGDALTGALATTAVQASDVGSYVISQGTLAAPLNNYALSFTSGTLTINPAQLSVAVNDAARLYGDANPQFSAVITGFKLGQDSSVLSGLAFSTTATQTSNVGSYTVASSGGTAMNYTITGRTNGTLTVTARPITVAANNLSRVYGGTNPALTYIVTSGGLVNGDRLTGALATSAVAASNVDGYAITQGSLAASSNYALTFAPGTLTVFARPITVIANDTTRIYGDANPSLTFAITSGNLVNGDTLAGALSTSAVLTSNVGNYSIARGSLTAGSNYSLNFQPGTFSITPRAITVTANGTNRVYGDANPNFTYAVSSGSLVNGDTLSGTLGTSAVLTSAVGNYAIGQGSLAVTTNYTLTFQSGTLSITPRSITVTANNTSRSYGDTNSLTYSITTGTLVNGDTLTGSLTTSAVQTSTVGTYAISQGTLTASSNYTVAFHGGTLTITPAALAVAVNNASRMYGYANPDFTAAITGFKNGEDASVVSGLVFLTDAARTSSVGTYAIKSSGGTAANYVIVTRTDGALTVEPLPAATTEQMNGVGTYLGNLPANQNDQNLPLCTNTEVIAVANDNGVSQVVLGAPQCR